MIGDAWFMMAWPLDRVSLALCSITGARTHSRMNRGAINRVKAYWNVRGMKRGLKKEKCCNRSCYMIADSGQTMDSMTLHVLCDDRKKLYLPNRRDKVMDTHTGTTEKAKALH